MESNCTKTTLDLSQKAKKGENKVTKTV
jgi:hypothetical protein